MSKVIRKIVGIACLMIGAAILYLEYIIICAIGALGSWIADLIGATGDAHTGITLLAYIPVIGLILFVLISAGLMFRVAYELFR